MPVLLLVSRLLLGGVFTVAGVAKLADLPGSRKALAGFGVPAVLVGPLGLLLPLVELAVAAALIPRSTAPYGAAAALVLLLVFAAGIGTSLVRGRRPACHCFGQLHSEPVGWPVLMRNAALGAVAAFVVFAGWTDPGPSATGWLMSLTDWQHAVVAGGTLGLAGMVAQSVLLLRLVNQNGQLLQRLASAAALPMGIAATSPTTTPAVAPSASSPTGPGSSDAAPAPVAVPATGRRLGSLAPAFSLPSLEGNQVTVASLGQIGRPTILFFSDPECGQCLNLLPDIAQWRQAYEHRFTLALISRGTPDENRAKFGDHPPGLVLMQRDREVVLAYGIAATPSAVLLAADGTIGSQTALGEVEVRQLVNGLTRVPSRSPAADLGFAPAIELSDLDGRPLGLDQIRGQSTVVLFWNPTCPYCERMLDDLKVWEALPLSERPELLVVSTGSVELNRAQSLRSRIVLDPGFTTGSRFGVEGTPSAVLVDGEGRMAGPPAVGAFAIFALVGRVGGLAAGTPAEPGSDADLRAPSVPLPVLPADAKPLQ